MPFTLLFALQACPEDTGDGVLQAGSGAAGGGAGPSFAATVQPLFNAACNCHQTSPILMAPFSLKPEERTATSSTCPRVS